MKLSFTISALACLALSSTVEGIRSRRRFLKKSKGKGKGKDQKSKGGGGPLYALLTSWAALSTSPDPEGLQVVTTVNFNPDDSALIHIAGTTGLPGCTSPADGGGDCEITIKESCNGMNLYHPSMASDPWADSSENYFITDPTTTETKSAFTIDFGLGYAATKGSAMVISTPDGDNWCGYLMSPPSNFNSLAATVGTYPEYSGSKELTPTGMISLKYGIDGTFTYSFKVEGLEPNCEGCGIHVHAGVSCETHAQVMGHGWNQAFVRDLWTATGGAVYSTDAEGYAEGEFFLYNGFDIFSNMNHAVVIHAQDGARLGCGVLKLVA